MIKKKNNNNSNNAKNVNDKIKINKPQRYWPFLYFIASREKIRLFETGFLLLKPNVNQEYLYLLGQLSWF